MPTFLFLSHTARSGVRTYHREKTRPTPRKNGSTYPNQRLRLPSLRCSHGLLYQVSKCSRSQVVSHFIRDPVHDPPKRTGGKRTLVITLPSAGRCERPLNGLIHINESDLVRTSDYLESSARPSDRPYNAYTRQPLEHLRHMVSRQPSNSGDLVHAVNHEGSMPKQTRPCTATDRESDMFRMRFMRHPHIA